MRSFMLLAVASTPGLTLAQVDFYTSKADFDAAASTSIGVTFEEPAWDSYVGVSGPTPRSFNGITFASLDQPNLFVAPKGQLNFGALPESRVLTVSGNENIDLTFDVSPLAVGFVSYANGADPATVTVELAGGDEIVWVNEQPPNSIGYVGIVASEPIVRVNWLAVSGEVINTGIDEVAWDTAICSADCNADGALNVLDFVCFQSEWMSQTAAGDCNADGAFDVLDFICFQSVFVTGCP